MLIAFLDNGSYGLNSIITPQSHSFTVHFAQHINPTDEDNLARNHGHGTYLTAHKTKIVRNPLHLIL